MLCWQWYHQPVCPSALHLNSANSCTLASPRFLTLTCSRVGMSSVCLQVRGPVHTGVPLCRHCSWPAPFARPYCVSKQVEATLVANWHIMLVCMLFLCAADDHNSLKALYRRGQAYAALHSYQEAARDLAAAAELSSNDPPQLQLIKEKLAAVQEKLASQPEPVQQAPAQEPQQQRQQQQEPEPVQPQAAPQQETAKQQHQQPEAHEQQQQQPEPKQQADVQQSTGSKAASSTQPSKQQASKPPATVEEEDGLIEEIVDDRQPKASVGSQADEIDLDEVIGGSVARATTSDSRRAAAAAASSRAAATSSRSAAPAPAAGFAGMPDMQQMAQMMQSNPGMMRQVGPSSSAGGMLGFIAVSILYMRQV